MASRAREWASRHGAHLKRVGLVVALTIFLGGLYIAVTSLPEIPAELELRPLLVLVLVGVPITIALNTYEFWIMTRAAGNPAGWRSCLDVTVFASAANMFSLPGGILTRTTALMAFGTPLGRSSQVIFSFAAFWFGISFGYAGAWLVAQEQASIGALLSMIGAAFVMGSAVGFLRLRMSALLIVQLFAMRVAAVLVEASRNVMAVYAIGAVISFGEASVFSASSVAGAASTIVPGGLGIAEGLAALLSPLVKVNPAIGFLSVGINRIIFMAVLSALAGLLLLLNWSQQRKQGTF